MRLHYMRTVRLPRWFLWKIFFSGLFLNVGCGQKPDAKPEEPQISASGTEPLSASEMEQTRIFCGACHRVPDPRYFAKDAWYHEVERGFEFHAQASRTDLQPPPRATVVRFFRDQAPDKLPVPVPPASTPGHVTFRQEVIAAPESAGPPVAVSVLNWLKPEADHTGRLMISNMSGGEVFSVELSGQGDSHPVSTLARLDHPAGLVACDLDQNAIRDFVVADLGSQEPADHQRGRVVWLRGTASGQFEPVVLLDQRGRVADVQVADFNGDQREDILVAEFGWLKTGAVQLLLRTADTESDGSPKFELKTIDTRHGVIHLPVVDWNRDGHLDFVALFSQEYETIELFQNDGSGNFQRRTLNPPEDPAFGSSGIQLVDLDGDGDLDVLYTNGDTFDSQQMKFFHGIQWLENEGTLPLRSHRITDLPGVHRALAGDLDGDGDQDILAVVFLSENGVRDAGLRPDDLDSVIWLEQVLPGEFRRHSLETGHWFHAALTTGDFDGDGDLDFATGNFLTATRSTTSPLTIWWNETIKQPGKP